MAENAAGERLSSGLLIEGQIQTKFAQAKAWNVVPKRLEESQG